MCHLCAADFSVDALVAEPGLREASAAEDIGEDVGEVTVDMVRVELQRMAQNVERMGSIAQGADGVGGLGGMMGDLHAQLDNMRDNMVTRDAYDRLFDRIRRLESDVEAAAGMASEEQALGGEFFLHEQSGDVDDVGDASDYGYFDGDGNYIESEDEHAEWDD